MEAVADEPKPPQADAVGLEPVEPRVGEEELSRVVVDGAGPQNEKRSPIDGQRPSAQKPGVGMDEAADRALRDIPDRVGVHERAALEHRDRVGAELGWERSLRARDAPIDRRPWQRIGRRWSLADHGGCLAHDWTSLPADVASTATYRARRPAGSLGADCHRGVYRRLTMAASRAALRPPGALTSRRPPSPSRRRPGCRGRPGSWRSRSRPTGRCRRSWGTGSRRSASCRSPCGCGSSRRRRPGSRS